MSQEAAPEGQSVSNPGTVIGGNNSTHLRQKRARSQLSCTPCRVGKLKCNRENACDQCIKRNRESACTYVPPPSKSKATQNVKGRIRHLESLVVDLMNKNQEAQSQQPPEASKKRPADLGGDGSNAGQEPRQPLYWNEPTPPSDAESSQAKENGQEGQRSPDPDVGPAFGELKISKNEISYVGESHWKAILNGISDLKKEIGDDDDDDAEDDCSSENIRDVYGNTRSRREQQAKMYTPMGPGIMFGGVPKVTKEQLIASLPDKKVLDRKVNVWFTSPDPFKPVIHGPTFQNEYKRFIAKPNETPTMWLALLYSILSCATSFGLRGSDPSTEIGQRIAAEANKLHDLCASAMLLADFTQPKQYTIETLTVYTSGLLTNDQFVNIWLMLGLIIRLALRMGLHRDPKHFHTITAFQGEMRRRIWTGLSMIDILISSSLALPSMVRTIETDTAPPSNLLDRDFNVNTKVLPPSRGENELTPSSYARAKVGLARVFADANVLSHQTVHPPYDDVIKCDEALEEARSNIPPLLRMPTDRSETVTDPPEQLMCRFNLDLLYLKTKIILHRRYMTTPLEDLSPAEQTRGIGISRTICIGSALRMLEHHATVHALTQDGGQLDSMKWYMGSISTNDFLLAAMVICLELSQQISDLSTSLPSQPLDPGLSTPLPSSKSGSTLRACPNRAAMMEAIERSQKIWADTARQKRVATRLIGSADTSSYNLDETEKASRAMAVMIERVKARFPLQAKEDEPIPHLQGMFHQGGTKITDKETLKEAQDATPFNGLYTTYQWGAATGVPHDFQIGQPWSSEDTGDFSSNGNVENGMSSGEPSIGATSSNYMAGLEGMDIPQTDFDMIDGMLDLPTDLNWGTWDQATIPGGQREELPSFLDWNEGPGVPGASNYQNLADSGLPDQMLTGGGPTDSWATNNAYTSAALRDGTRTGEAAGANSSSSHGQQIQAFADQGRANKDMMYDVHFDSDHLISYDTSGREPWERAARVNNR